MKEGCRENGKNENKEIPSKIKHNKNVRVSVGISNRTNKRTTFIFTRIGCTKTRIYFITIKTNIRYPVVGIYIYIYTRFLRFYLYVYLYTRTIFTCPRTFSLAYTGIPRHVMVHLLHVYYTYRYILLLLLLLYNNNSAGIYGHLWRRHYTTF